MQHQLKDLEYAIKHDDEAVRLGAIAELGGYGKQAIPVLQIGVQDESETVRQMAMRTIAKIGGTEAAEVLAELLTAKDRYTRSKAILLLPLAGRPAYPYLLEALSTEPFPRARMFAAHGITRLARPGDAPDIMERFERQDKATKMHLVIALVRVGDEEAYKSLDHLMRTGDPLVRFYVANTIADAPPSKRALPILTYAMDDEAVEVRMWAIFGLERLNLPTSYPTVVDALDDESFYVRKEAVYTLGTLGNPAAIPHLISALKDPHYLVRGNAAESLGMLGDPEVIPALIPLLDEEQEAVRIRAAEALVRLNDYRGMEILIAILDSPHLLYRKEAHKALQRISNEDFGKDRAVWSRWWNQAKETLKQRPPDTSDD
jgi:HEAT repeat protein